MAGISQQTSLGNLINLIITIFIIQFLFEALEGILTPPTV
ncbi:hypothetical protein SAMN04488698_10115 [Candidatus Frackibacter sp. WG12]|nr:MAG: hypothetical protein AWU54_614 [Candidatus Frackibacter sp. T328-2]SDB96335.1 hypothetical protein SAMN04515661_10114 [Candidatus Frackibacter sp. WG11]SEM27771.1 hypothetical protein SAMN04488698_10115 [Candidatus Frackibacter sp. WG12]SFL32566.1 hypothetical protein SAMN04488699_10115 [Candidatus Frackibacter sp. WG13]